MFSIVKKKNKNWYVVTAILWFQVTRVSGLMMYKQIKIIH